MDDIITRAEQLAAEIKSSALYKEYLEARTVVAKNPEYQNMIGDYLVMRAKTVETGDDSLERRKREAGAYFSLESNRDVRRFLDTWRAVTDQICDIIDVFASLAPEDLPGDIYL